MLPLKWLSPWHRCPSHRAGGHLWGCQLSLTAGSSPAIATLLAVGVSRDRDRGWERGRGSGSAARDEALAGAGGPGRWVTAALFPPQVAAMEHRGASPLLLALALLSALCWRARALPPRGAAFPPVPR